jgi:membrane dipeptidase
MGAGGIPLAKEIGRVPSMTVPLNREQERRYWRLMEEAIMVDVHEHPMILPEDIGQFIEYLRSNNYKWGYAAVKHGGWTAVATANVFRGLRNAHEISFIDFEDLVAEVGMMLADVSQQRQVVKVTNAYEIESAKQQGKVGFLPTLEHLAIGNGLDRVDVLYSIGIRLAGLTYNRKNYIGDGLYERNDGGLSEFGIEVVHRMNELGMAIDLSHASFRTAMDAIEFSQAPVVFSHNAAYTLRPTRRSRRDEELVACAQKGGLIAITAVPNSLSDDPEQDIECVLDHYDYMVRLVGVDHVGIGTDTTIGDHVDFHRKMMGRDAPGQLPAPYLNGLESPADGGNILRGLISRGYSDTDIKKIVGGNVLAFMRRVMY